MCLYTVDKEIKRKKLRREGKYVICWKTVRKPRVYTKQSWSSFWTAWPYKDGWNTFGSKRSIAVGTYCSLDRYIPYCHAYRTREAARKQNRPGYSVVRCKTFLKYITATGQQGGQDLLITKKIWIPKYPARE